MRTEDEVLIEAGIERASGLIAALSEDTDNLFVTLTARRLNKKSIDNFTFGICAFGRKINICRSG